MTLYGAAKTPAAALTADGTVVVALTDNSTGSVSETIAEMVNTAALTNSTGGTPNDVLAAATNMSLIADSSGGTANDTIADIGGTYNQAEVANAVSTFAEHFIVQRTWNIAVLNGLATLADEMIVQKAANTVLVNAVASLANKLSDLITHLNDGR